ncbi:MAG: GDSL-type esterase/lipase family protein [Verrucomicrobiales bacterium]|nr:GDSL-type esterase/lipase family protein [Verrucomicrobiales bacterium]
MKIAISTLLTDSATSTVMRKLLLIVSVLSAIQFSHAQDVSFTADVAKFAAKDQAESSLLAANPILFIGSSSFTKWQDVGAYFPDKKILNRAFGGSRLTDQIYFLPEVVLKYQPKKIILYCGENDVAGGANSEVVLDRLQIWFRQVRKNLPDCEIVYLSIKYSPSREKFFPVVREANQKIQAWLAQQPNAKYADITACMQDANGKLRTDIFTKDMLHMNPEGYKLWQKVLAPYL